MALDQFALAPESKGFKPQLCAADLLQLEASQLFGGIKDGFIDEVNNAVDNPLATGAVVTTSAAFSLALTALSYRKPAAAEALSTLAKKLFLVDVGVRSMGAVEAGVDTWFEPENYAQNKALVARELGGGLANYAGFAAFSAPGFKLGKILLGKDDRDILKAAFAGAEIPKLERIRLGKAVAGEESPQTPAGKLYTSLKDSVVIVANEDGTGSGFFVDRESGLIATNYHVVRGATQHWVRMSDGTIFPVELAARDKFADVVLLRPKVTESRVWPAAELGSTAELQPGQNLLTIGHPAGIKREVLSTGSFKGIQSRYSNVPDTSPTMAIIDMKMPALPGSSGSPVFSEQAKVVGIIAATASNESYGASAEHLNEMVKLVRANKPLEGWLEIKSRLVTGQGGPAEEGATGGPGALTILATAKVRNRQALAARMVPLYQTAHQSEAPVVGLDLYSQSPFRLAIGTAAGVSASRGLVHDVKTWLSQKKPQS